MNTPTHETVTVTEAEKSAYARLRATQQENPELATGGAVSLFSLSQVKFAQDRIAATGMVARIAEWRAEDVEAMEIINGKKHAGGRPRKVSFTDEHILIGMFLLAREHSPLFIKSLSTLFRFRLTAEARTYLDLDRMATTGEEFLQAEKWYTRTDRALHDLIDVMDAYPAKRQIGNRAERTHWENRREENAAAWNLEQKVRRKDEFAFAFTQMTMKMIDPEMLALWGGSVSIDQTTVRAPSKRGFKKGERLDPTVDSRVLEPQAGWCIKDPDKRGNAGHEHASEAVWGYKANFAVMVAEDPLAPRPFPRLIVGMSLSSPGSEVGEEAVRLLERLKGAGYKTGRVTTDKEYAAQMTPDRYAFPLTALGYSIVTDYKRDKLDVQGQQRGALIVGGAYVCPGMPKKLQELHSTYLKQYDEMEDREKAHEKKYTREEKAAIQDKYDEQLAEMKKYHLRQKQAADEHGTVKMMCPAAGSSPTAMCPLKPKSMTGPGKNRVIIVKPPANPDDVCLNEVVAMKIVPNSRYLQPVQYKSKQWRIFYSYDRNMVEGINAQIKDTGREAMDSSGRRRLRGFTAQAFLSTFLVMSLNMRMIESFNAEQARPEHRRNVKRPSRSRTQFSQREYEPRIPEVRAQLGLPPLDKTPVLRFAKSETTAARTSTRR